MHDKERARRGLEKKTHGCLAHNETNKEQESFGKMKKARQRGNGWQLNRREAICGVRGKSGANKVIEVSN